MRLSKLSITAVLVLLISTLVPAQPSTAVDDTFTKTVTVTRPNGTPYAGAQVALEVWNDETQTRSVTPPQTTNSSGVATITAPINGIYVSAIAEPPVGDHTYALTEEYSGVEKNNVSSSLTIQLNVANKWVTIQNPDGSPAAAAAGIFYPGTNPSIAQDRGLRTLRTGTFGLDFAPDLPAGNYVLTIESATRDVQFTKSYGLKSILDNTVPTIYTTVKNETALQPDSNGVYNLRLGSSNIRGSLNSPDGSPFALPSGAMGRIGFIPADSDGNPDWSLESGTDSVDAPISANGNFTAFVPNLQAGKYFPVVYLTGLTTISSFVGDAFWVNSSLQYSNAENGTYTTSSAFWLGVKLPSTDNSTPTPPNAKVRFQLSANPTADFPGYFWVVSQSSNFQLNNHSQTGSFGLSLEDGLYRVGYFAFDRTIGYVGDYDMTVSNGSVTSLERDGSSDQITPIGGVFKVNVDSPNLKVKAVSPDAPTVALQNINSNISKVYESPVSVGNEYNGYQYLSVPSGQDYYLTLDVDPNGTSSSDNPVRLVQTRYHITFSNGETTATNLAGDSFTSVGGVLTLSMDVANVVAKVTGPSGQALGACCSLDVSIQKKNVQGQWEYVNQQQTPLLVGNGTPDLSGNLGFKVATAGTYRLFYNPYSRSDLAMSHSSEFVVTSDQLAGGVNSKNLGTVKVSAPQILIKVASPVGSVITHTNTGQTGSVTFYSADLSSGYGYGADYNTGLLAYAWDSPGTYSIEVQAPTDGSVPGATNKKYEVVVSAGQDGKLSAAVTGVDKDADGVYVLRLGTGNVAGTVVGSDSNPVALGNNLWIDVQLQKLNTVTGNFDWIDGWARVSYDGKFTLNVADTGTYRVVLQPNGTADYGSTYSQPFTISTPGEEKTLPTIHLSSSTFKVTVAPDNSSTATNFTWINIQKQGASNSFGATTGPNGLAGINISEAGTYTLTVFPNQDGSAAGATVKTYTLTATSSNNQISVSIAGAQPENGVYHLHFGAANVTGRILDSLGAPVGSNQYVGVHIDALKLNSANGQYEYHDLWADATLDGSFALSITDPGTYKLKFSPRGRSDAASTFSDSFTIANGDTGFAKNFGDLRLNAPNVAFVVRADGSSNNVSNSGVEIRKDDQFIDWASTSTSGVGTINLTEAGTYTLTTNPAGDGSTPGATRKIYTAVATSNSSGGLDVTIAGAAKDADGNWILPLGSANLKGVVKDPSGNPVLNSNVVAVDISTGNQLWEISANSNSQGAWAMTLPQGTYKIFARVPWNTSQFGDSDLIGTFTVAANGSVTSTGGLQATNLDLRLKNPTWSGSVVSPNNSSQSISNASICMRTDSATTYACTQTDSNGNWAISAPTGFSDFDASAEIIIDVWGNADFSEKRITGKSAVIAALGSYTAGHTYTGISLSPAVPNVNVTVTGGGIPISNIWVDSFNDGGYLGGGVTDSQGVAHINIANPQNGFTVNTHPENNSSVSNLYVGVQKVVGDCGANGCNVTVQLSAPNFLGTVIQPATGQTSGSPVGNTNIELDNASGNFIQNVGTSQTGQFALRLDSSQTYTVVVNPAWNDSTGTATRKSYTVALDSAGSITVTAKDSTTVINKTSNRYALALGVPAVSGTVTTDTGTPVSDSYIVPIDSTGWQMWQLGGNSKAGGSFALALADGSYQLQANVPWNIAGYAKSATCSVTISGGSVTSSVGGCINQDESVTLKLRSPNLKFILTKPNSTDVVPNASVGIQIGNWSTWAQSASDGSVSIFVDRDAVVAANPSNANNLQIHMYIEPPYGNSDVVRVDCIQGQSNSICAAIPAFNSATDYPITDLGTVHFTAPNTQLFVKAPDGSAVGAGAWVNLWKVDGGNRTWIGGSNTDTNGKASFNLDSATIANNQFAVEVNAPGSTRSIYAQKTYGLLVPLTFAQTNGQSFRLVIPNLKLSILQAGGQSPSRWAWANVQVKDEGAPDSAYGWAGGYGTDEQGLLSVNIVPGSVTQDVRVTLNPGPGSEGAVTVCSMKVSVNGDSSGLNCPMGVAIVAGLPSTALSAGNVTGSVVDSSSHRVAGAIVFAESADHDTVQATTNSTGNFGMQLDPSKTWTLKVFYVNPPDTQSLLGQQLDPQPVVFANNSATVSLVLPAGQ